MLERGREAVGVLHLSPIMATSTAVARRASASPSGYLRELWERRDFTRELAFGNMAGRYAGNVLGVLWWVLNPLLMTAV